MFLSNILDNKSEEARHYNSAPIRSGPVRTKAQSGQNKSKSGSDTAPDPVHAHLCELMLFVLLV